MKTVFLFLAVLLFAGTTSCGKMEVSPYKSLSVQTISVSLSISSKIARKSACCLRDEASANEDTDASAQDPEGKTQNPPLVTTHN